MFCIFECISGIIKATDYHNARWKPETYFLSVSRTTFLAHLVFDTTYGVFRRPRHWVMDSCTFGIKMVDITSKSRIAFDFCHFESETHTVCRNVCNHLPSNVASYNRRKVSLFIPL
jgi:hypothetical protein